MGVGAGADAGAGAGAGAGVEVVGGAAAGFEGVLALGESADAVGTAHMSSRRGDTTG